MSFTQPAPDAIDALTSAIRHDCAQVGARVRQIRLRRGLTQAATAEAAGVTISAISRIENGQRHGSLTIMLAIAERLEVGPEDLARPPIRADDQAKLAQAWIDGAQKVLGWFTHPIEHPGHLEQLRSLNPYLEHPELP